MIRFVQNVGEVASFTAKINAIRVILDLKKKNPSKIRCPLMQYIDLILVESDPRPMDWHKYCSM